MPTFSLPIVAAIALLILAGDGGAHAQTAAPGLTPPDSGRRGDRARWLDHEHMSGSLTGRDSLAARGLTVLVTSVTDASAGTSTRHGMATSLRALVTASAAADLESLAGWRGGELLLQVQTRPGGYRQALVGERQGISNIDAPRFTRIAEFWLQQEWEGARVKVGQIDLSTEIALTEPANEFLNPSFAVSPTQAGFPTFPEPRPGAVGELSHGLLAVRVAAFAAEEGRLDYGFGEVDVRRGRWRGAMGWWVRRSSDPAPDRGFQLVADHHTTLGSGRELAAFVRVGRSGRGDGARAHNAVGVVGNALGRARDVAGLAITHARFEAGAGPSHEATFEAFYAYRAGRWLELRPDLQLVVGPGHVAGVGTLRTSICF